MRPYTSTPLIGRDQAKSTSEYRQSITQYKPKFYKTKVQNNSNEQFLQNTLRDPPNSREFKKTIPTTMIQDKERLYEELNKTKQQCNALQLDNYQLRVQVKTLETAVMKIDEQEENTFSHQKPLRRMPQEQSQSTVVIQLKKQMKDLRQDLEDYKEELIRVKRSAKLTKLQELEAELKTYSDETIRLKGLLHQQILQTHNPTKTEQNIEDRIIQLEQQLDQSQQKNINLQKKLDLLREQTANLSLINQELDQNFQKSNMERIQLKKQLTSLEEQFNKAQLNDPLFRRGQDVTQIKLELEKNVVENNQLKNENLIKTRRIHELERNIKEITNTFQEKLNAVTKEKEQFKDKYEKNKQELIELQDKYQQLFFNSNRNLSQQSIRRDAILTVQSQDEKQDYIKSLEPTPKMFQSETIHRGYQRKLTRNQSMAKQT